jgi:hypothetical protein
VRLRGRAKKEMMARRALADMAAWAIESGVMPDPVLHEPHRIPKRSSA